MLLLQLKCKQCTNLSFLGNIQQMQLNCSSNDVKYISMQVVPRSGLGGCELKDDHLPCCIIKMDSCWTQNSISTVLCVLRC